MSSINEIKCPRCLATLSSEQPEICQQCGARFIVPPESQIMEKRLPDPDRPGWSIWDGIGIWFFSVLLIIGAPIVAIFIWTGWQFIHGVKFSGGEKAFNNPPFIILFVVMTFIAQMITLLVSYGLIVKRSEGNFWDAIGWHWKPPYKLWVTILVTIVVLVAAIAISNLLPNKENDLEKLLNVSFTVRLLIAVLAVASAPMVEELIYRGILYSALRKRWGMWPAFMIVSLLFVGVHVPQYWGAWGVIASLLLLSSAITLLRALSGSLLPSFTMHMFFNGVQAVGIIIQGLAKK
jgi:membrane protease YdiL (CAAX protease family)